jgi:hypothetical protein
MLASLFHLGTFGVGFGNIIAAGLSWHRNKSIPLAVVHFLCGWVYVIWYIFTEGKTK